MSGCAACLRGRRRFRVGAEAGAPVGRRMPAVVLLLLALAIVATAWLLLSALSARPAVSTEANAFAARAFAMNRFGYGAGRLAWYDGGLAALQVAGYETITGALRRSTTVVTAAREAMSIAAVLSAVALTVAARRLRLSAPAVVAVPVLFGLTPAALVLHRTVDPVQLGVLWACVALALAGGGRAPDRYRGRLRRLPRAGRRDVAAGAGRAGAAVRDAGVVRLARPVRTEGATRRGRRRTGRLRRVGRAGGRRATFPVAGRRRSLASGRSTGSSRSPRSVPVSPGCGSSWLRPLAVALLATVVAAAAVPDVRGSLVLVALPLGAVVLPAATEAGIAALGRRQEPWPSGRLVVVGALAIAAVLAWMPTLDTVREPADGSDQAAAGNARAWVFANLPSRPKLVVDDAMWAGLVESGYPAEQLAEAGGIGPDHPSWPWTEARYVVGRDEALIDAADPVGEAWSRSTLVASFGDEAETITIRRVVTDPDEIATARREQAGRIAAGQALAANPRLGLVPKAANLIGAGQVDSRAVAVLAAMTGQHSLQIVDFPVVPGEDAGAPRRLIAVAAVDGKPVGAGASALTALDMWLRAQQPPYRPTAAELSQLEGRPVLLIRYDALGSTGLLPP